MRGTGWAVAFALGIAGPAGAGEPRSVESMGKDAGGAAAPTDPGPTVFQFDFGSTPRPAKPLHVNLLEHEPDPDLLPKDNAGLNRATLDFTHPEFEWGDAGYQGTGEGRKIAFFAKAIKIGLHLVQTVAVSNQYAEGSCTFKETFKHELEHFEANERIFRESLPMLVKAAEALRAKIPIGSPTVPVYPKATSKEVGRYQDFVVENVNKLLEAFKRHVGDRMRGDRNQKDSVFSYDKVFEGCAKWEGAKK